LKVIDVDKIKKPVSSTCYDKQHVPIRNRFNTMRANNNKITSFQRVPFYDALVREEPP